VCRCRGVGATAHHTIGSPNGVSSVICFFPGITGIRHRVRKWRQCGLPGDELGSHHGVLVCGKEV
jgi:hypothetical protein